MEQTVNKVVVNKCYGGFSLPDKAIEWLKENARQEIKDYIKSIEEDEELGPTYCSYALVYEFNDGEGIARHDSDLIRCVEKLKEGASGEYAELCVVKIIGNQYKVREYDGAEWVETPDSIDWITIE